MFENGFSIVKLVKDIFFTYTISDKSMRCLVVHRLPFIPCGNTFNCFFLLLSTLSRVSKYSYYSDTSAKMISDFLLIY